MPCGGRVAVLFDPHALTYPAEVLAEMGLLGWTRGSSGFVIAHHVIPLFLVPLVAAPAFGWLPVPRPA